MTIDWRQRGLCAQSAADLFYPPPDDDDLAAPAKAICVACPVCTPCLEWALTRREKFGVWGGMTERERRRLLRSRRRSA